MKTSIVVGISYGDEGKGLTVSNLAGNKDLVVRFNGGHQAGHTVVKNGYRHIFSNFGSGTLNGAHTYWSEYCTFHPQSFHNERAILRAQGYDPVFYIHPLAMVTTPFDILHNQQSERDNKHGSVGVGYGSTVGRHEDGRYKLHAIDLQYSDILRTKLRQIAAHYGMGKLTKEIDEFMYYTEELDLKVQPLHSIAHRYEHVIFEGAQGIMLDRDFGYFPHVTRSYTTSSNAIELIKDNGLEFPDMYYVMRAYLTRHGNGPMPNERDHFNHEDLTNVTHEFQGKFRQGFHSKAELDYALNCDDIYSGQYSKNRHLVITCLSQTNNNVLLDGKRINVSNFTDMMQGFKYYHTYAEQGKQVV